MLFKSTCQSKCFFSYWLFTLFFCPLATCERGKHLMSSGGISVWIPCARTGVSDAACGKMKTQQFLPARRVRNRSCKSLLEKMFNPMIWSILFNIYKQVLWTAIFQSTISMAYFQSTNTTWWNRHNFVVFFFGRSWNSRFVLVNPLDGNLWLCLGNDSQFVGGNVGSGCWRMETHETSPTIWIRYESCTQHLPNQPGKWKTFWELKLLQHLRYVYRFNNQTSFFNMKGIKRPVHQNRVWLAGFQPLYYFVWEAGIKGCKDFNGFSKSEQRHSIESWPTRAQGLVVDTMDERRDLSNWSALIDESLVVQFQTNNPRCWFQVQLGLIYRNSFVVLGRNCKSTSTQLEIILKNGSPLHINHLKEYNAGTGLLAKKHLAIDIQELHEKRRFSESSEWNPWMIPTNRVGLP